MSIGVGRLRHRLGWGVTDQVLSSVTNYLLALVMVRSVSLDDVGAFSLVLAAYVFLVGVFRAFAAKPFAIRLATATPTDQHDATAGLAGLALLVGLGAGLVLGVVAAIIGGTLGPLLLVLAVGLAGLLVQDALRFAAVSTGRAHRAAWNDGLWLGLSALGLALTAGTGEPTALLAVWVASGAFAGIVAARRHRVLPRPTAAMAFLREHGRLSAPMATEQTVSQGSNQLGLFILAGILPLSDLGSLRSAQLMLSPLNVVQQAAPLVGLPEARRRCEQGPRSLRPLLIRIGGALAVLAVMLTLALLVLPDRIGVAIFGDGWAAAQPLIVAVGLRNTFGGLGLAAVIGLHAMEQARTTLNVGVVRGGLSITAGVVGGLVLGLEGAVWSLVAAEAAGALLAVQRCTVATRSGDLPEPGTEADEGWLRVPVGIDAGGPA